MTTKENTKSEGEEKSSSSLKADRPDELKNFVHNIFDEARDKVREVAQEVEKRLSKGL